MNAPSDSAVLLAALAYAADGIPVFPCSPVDKKPLTKHGFKDASTDPKVIRAWWRKWPRALIGSPTGQITGRFVADLDLGDPLLISASDYLARFRDHVGGKIPETAISETGSGGLHLVFRWPAEGGIGIGANMAPALFIPPVEGTKTRDGKAAKGAQVDIRGDGGYVILPPSVRADGGRYTWCPGPEDGIAEAPEAILRIARGEEAKAARGAARPTPSSRSRPSPGPTDDAGRRYAVAALAREADELASMHTGGRNNRLNVAAMKMGQLVAAGVLAESEVRAALEDASQRCGLVGDDGWASVHKTFAKGFEKGMSEPRDLSDVGARARDGRALSPKEGARERPSPEGQDVPTEGRAPRDGDKPQGGRPGRSAEFDLDEMNERWALVMVGSRTVMLHEDPLAPLEDRVRIVKVDAFQQWFSNRFTEIRDAEGKVKTVTHARAWLTSFERRQYRGMEFHPDPENRAGTPGYFNTWRGFAIKPVPKHNGYAIFRDHVLTNICGGDAFLFTWVFAFLAQMFQRPRERLGVALVLRGKQGVGKTKLGEVIGRLIPENFYLVDNPRYLVGQFNVHMASCLLLQADEAVWAGNKEAEGRLKGLITAAEQMIEPKGVDSIRLKNHVRLIMTSNEDWVVPAGKEERRFCVLDVGDRCMQNIEYFAAMEAELEDGGHEALLHDLLAFDLSKVDLRHIPKTAALLEQKVHSFGDIDSWWYDRLTNGSTLSDEGDWLTEVGCKALYLDYVAEADQTGVRRKSDPNVFGKRLGKLVPGILKRRPRVPPERWAGVDARNKRPWLYLMPTLTECRDAFEEQLGQPLTWPEEHDSD